MERLTIRTPAGVSNLDYPQSCFYPDGTKDQVAVSAYRQKAIDRLAAYEDTGLPPEEILMAKEQAEVACALNLLKEYQSVGSIEHFRELSQAEHDGRLVVLPCKKGDTVWYETFMNGKSIGICAHTISEISITLECSLGSCSVPSHVPLWDLGKTTFLTRKEAEAALAEKGEENGRVHRAEKSD